MEGQVPLDIRKQQILKAVVRDYTETAVPVGSQVLASKLLTWSSATIRNDLATLVEIGYLLQPHTSAGRIPSDRGYRYYVDFLMEEEEVPVAVRRQVDPLLPEHPVDVNEVLEAAAMVLARVSDSVSIVTGPRALGAAVKHLDLVSLDERHALLVLLLEGNLLRQQVVELSTAADQDALTALAVPLGAELRGADAVAVAGLRAQAPAAGGPRVLRDEVLGHVERMVREVEVRQDTVVIHDGVRNLLRQPEFGDVERLHQVLDVVEEERALGQVLAAIDVDQGISVVIGTETGVEQLSGCSLVLTTYRAGKDRRGTIGVLGPTRMRYQQVAPRLRYVALCAGRALDRFLG